MYFTHRNIAIMILLMLLTGGLYIFYWFFVTKNEFNCAGARIPSFFLFFIPIANFYFLYHFSQAYARLVLKDETQTLLNFLFIVFLIPAGAIVYQIHLNESDGQKNP